jgi:hypothetical protein
MAPAEPNFPEEIPPIPESVSAPKEADEVDGAVDSQAVKNAMPGDDLIEDKALENAADGHDTLEDGHGEEGVAPLANALADEQPSIEAEPEANAAPLAEAALPIAAESWTENQPFVPSDTQTAADWTETSELSTAEAPWSEDEPPMNADAETAVNGSETAEFPSSKETWPAETTPVDLDTPVASEQWTKEAPWSETDLPQPQGMSDSPMDSDPWSSQSPIRRTDPQPSARGQRSAGNNQREAEKPVNVADPYDAWGEADVPYQPKELGVIDQLMLVLADGATLWRKLMRWVRSQLPPGWQRQLNEDMLTAISLGVLVLFLALWNPLGLGPQASQPGDGTLIASQTPSPADLPLSDAGTAPAENPELPTLSPEDSLIADIQERVAQISHSYASGLIQSVEVNLPENRLIVNLGENWYGLLHTQQDAIAADISRQVDDLDFQKLELRDPDDRLVARNAVVGHNMVILWRERSTGSELLAFAGQLA